MRSRIVGLVAGGALVLLLAWASLGVGQARAEPVPSPPSGSINSRCASVSVSPQVVHRGQKLTASASPAIAWTESQRILDGLRGVLP
jgi:hypothetical protein